MKLNIEISLEVDTKDNPLSLDWTIRSAIPNITWDLGRNGYGSGPIANENCETVGTYRIEAPYDD